MDRYEALLALTELFLSEEGADGLAEAILRKLVEHTGAERGFIVVREGSTFELKVDVSFDPDRVSPEERRVSRRLVREVIESRTPFVADDIVGDPRVARFESVEQMGPRAVLVVPLHAGDRVYGVVYLEQTTAPRRFSAEAVGLSADVARVAGAAMRRALEHDELKQRAQSLERGLSAQYDFAGIVTRDPAMHALLKMVAQVARSDTNVLITGETGTGKELVAQAVHLNGTRAKRPFVVLHCTALAPTLLESELFGHVRGAFTGADRDRGGRVAAAQHGTLFLDEIAEISLELQVKLLRFLQFGEIQRLGSDRVEKVDVRIVAATHRDLRAMVEAKTFRQDLYYRLRVVELTVPPLRDRRGDIPLLLDAFLSEPAKNGLGRLRFSSAALELLMAHDYPGNVRELAHIVERARVLSTSPELGVDLLPPDLVPPAEHLESTALAGPLPHGLAMVRERAEKAFLADLLTRAGGNISLAGRESGIHRSHLQRLLSKHGLRSG